MLLRHRSRTLLLLLCALAAPMARAETPNALPVGAAPTGGATPPTASAAPSPESYYAEVDRIEGNKIYFKAPEGATSGKALKVDLYDIKYMGSITPSGGGVPYLLLAGRPCENCMQDIGLYSVRATGGKPTQFIYPGKIFESRTRATILDSKGFVGRCLFNRKNDVYVVFQRERIERKRRVRNLTSVYIAEGGPDHLEERLLERGFPRLQDTLRLVKAKRCREVPGRNRLMLSRSIDIRLHKASQEEDDDDDEDDAADAKTAAVPGNPTPAAPAASSPQAPPANRNADPLPSSGG